MGITKNKPLLAGVGVVAAAFIAWLAFGFFGIQAAFIDNEVNETTDGLFDEVATTDSATDEPASTDTDGEADEAMADDADEEAMADDADDEAMDDNADGEAMADTDEPVTNEIVTTFDGDFSSLNNYSVTGDAFVLSNGTDQRFLRFENFESSNGPDLKVYLRAENGDFVSLGELSGNIGDQNYEIPADVDLTEFSRVEIWCERFSRGFGAADLVAV